MMIGIGTARFRAVKIGHRYVGMFVFRLRPFEDVFLSLWPLSRRGAQSEAPIVCSRLSTFLFASRKGKPLTGMDGSLLIERQLHLITAT